MKLSKKGKAGKAPRTVSFEIMFWKTKNGTIHIGSNDREAIGFNVAVRSDATKPSGHPHLYKRLDAFLRKKGALDISEQ